MLVEAVGPEVGFDVLRCGIKAGNVVPKDHEGELGGQGGEAVLLAGGCHDEEREVGM